MKSLINLIPAAVFAIILSSCGQRNNNPGTSTENENTNAPEMRVVLKDYGKLPTVLNIESYTLSNDNYRQTLWTGTNLQLTLMSIPAGGDIGLEMHPDIDQFIRIEEGEGSVVMGDAENNLDFRETVKEDYVILIPAGKWHNMINTGDKPLRLYSIYAPVEHPHGTVHKTQKESREAEHLH